MKIDDVIELENNQSYLLLMKTTLNNSNYYLAVGINDADETTDEYIVLQEVVEDNELYVVPVNDAALLAKLISDYQEDYDDEYNN